MMWDDTTPRAQEIGRWLDSPMNLDEFYGKRTYPLCAAILALWLKAYQLSWQRCTRRAWRTGGRISA